MSTTAKLLIRLREAADGHIALNGEDRPNLFQDAINEINRLRDIEVLAKAVFEPLTNNDEPFGSFGPRPTTSASAELRLKNGRKLGVAVGVFKESK